VAAYLANPDQPWADHFDFARGASAFKIQHLGNEAGLPTAAEVGRMHELFGEREARMGHM
jgi:sugar/nucleoside kinase (ribokinase family)